MTRASPTFREFAGRLLAWEQKAGKRLSSNSPSSVSVQEKLRLHLVAVMGTGGFRALLTRALTLAGAEMTVLRELQVNADGTLEGMEQLEQQLGPAEMNECREVLLAHLLGLLITFIGENLTCRLVGEIWPKLPVQPLVSVRKSI